MERESGFMDSDGNLSNDKDRLLKEYEDFWKKNPKKLERLNELKQRNKKFEDLQYRPLEAFEFVLQHGEFKQGCEFWFRSKIKEFECKKDDKGYFQFLTQEKTSLKPLIPKIKKHINLYPEVKEQFEFWLLSIEDLISTINSEIEHSKQNKAKSNDNKIAFGDVKTVSRYISEILTKINKLLFEDSTLQQWEQIMNLEKLESPLKVKNEITLKDLRYFFDKMQENHFIIENYITPLISVDAILFKNKLLKRTQLIEAKRDSKNAVPPHQDEIDNIFSK